MKTRQDVLTVIELGKPEEVVDIFIQEYLEGKAKTEFEAALAEYNTLLAPVEEIPVEEGQEQPLPVDNSARLKELETLYPQLLTKEELPLVLAVAEGKALKKLFIKEQFLQRSKTLKAQSIFGFTMDARREDVDNLRSLVEVLESMGAPGAEIRDADNQFHTLTTGMIKSLRMEMIQAGLGLFQQKWQAEQDLEAAADWRRA